MLIQLRETIDGHFTECRSDEEHVGKGRCNHIKAGKSVPIKVIGDNKIVESSKEIDIKKTIDDFKSMKTDISIEKQNKIVEILNSTKRRRSKVLVQN